MTDRGPATGGRIGARIAELVADGTVKARTALADGEQAVRQRANVAFAQQAEREGNKVLSRWMQAVMDDPDVSPYTKQAVEDVIAPRAFVQVIALLGMMVGAAFPMAMAAAAGFIADLTQWSLKHFGSVKLSPDALSRAVRLGIVPEAAGEQWARESGQQASQWAIQQGLERQLVPVGEVLQSLNRQLITESDALAQLRTQGFTDTDAATILALRFAFPTPSDLVRMAVREVFTPSVAQRFGQYEDLPPQFVELAQKVGMSAEFATWYWAAHWDLPSVQQGFEMLHRGVIGEADLNLLLKALDVMPFWRDKLQQISYNPLTRVDVRRMYRMGVATDTDVIQAYKDLGYTDENAARLLEFTKAEKLESERDLTKAEIVQLFEAQTFDRPKATSLLAELGYTGDEANFILNLAEHRRERSRLNRATNVVRARYITFKVAEGEAIAALDRLGLGAAERDEHLATWRVERDINAPALPVTTLARFLKKDIISEDGFRESALQLGYSPAEVDWYVVDTVGQPAEEGL